MLMLSFYSTGYCLPTVSLSVQISHWLVCYRYLQPHDMHIRLTEDFNLSPDVSM